MPIDDMLPAGPEPVLWAIHVQGPDTVTAAADRDEAEKHADGINRAYEALTRSDDFDPGVYPRIRAVVIEWPYDRAAHAEDLAAGDERWT
jgi:hypothetical protein